MLQKNLQIECQIKSQNAEIVVLCESWMVIPTCSEIQKYESNSTSVKFMPKMTSLTLRTLCLFDFLMEVKPHISETNTNWSLPLLQSTTKTTNCVWHNQIFATVEAKATQEIWQSMEKVCKQTLPWRTYHLPFYLWTVMTHTVQKDMGPAILNKTYMNLYQCSYAKLWMNPNPNIQVKQITDSAFK